jgi:hypothetical protein
MSTLGQLRQEIVQIAPGVALPVIGGFIRDRYTQVLDTLNWTRLYAQAILEIPSTYNTGTVAVTNGTTALTGAGTTWTALMTGRMFRIGSESQWYNFSYLSATTGTLDRAYMGTTAAAAGYKLNQNLVVLPAEARIIEDVICLDPPREMDRMGTVRAAEAYPNRAVYGNPLYWLEQMDTQSTAPAIQVELLPVPDTATSIQVNYIYDAAAPASTSSSFAPWVRNGTLKSGVLADVSMVQKDFNSADRYERQFAQRVQQAVANDCQRRGPVRMEMASRLTEHRVRRWLGGTRRLL